MQPAPAKKSDSEALERLGSATLQIVHDLKNQLNGLKLYATFLRKRLERDDQPPDERETLAKLITGLDRAAKELTALVRYARPIELRQQSGVDVQRIVAKVVADAAERETGSLTKAAISLDCENACYLGEFDQAALSEAFKAITNDVLATISAREPQPISVALRLNNETGEAEIEWRGGRFNTRSGALSPGGCGTIHTEVARKIIEAHHGAVSCDQDAIRARLPLTNEKSTDD
ncbi:MAG TPA: hypothetical protein VE961_05435 [Pyrinomonadaceae bacterium]|nr:hypothetical protein [Pyrinomonadaceae bacterium]